MNKPVRFLLVLFLAFIFCFIARGRCGGSADTFSTGEYNRLKLKADSAKVYCVDKGFNTNYCFLVDFCIHSGKKRFFVWDFRGRICQPLCTWVWEKQYCFQTCIQ